MTNEEFKKLYKLHNTLIGIYLEIDGAIERYLEIGCDMGFGQEMDSNAYLRILSQNLSDEMFFLYSVKGSRSLINSLHRTVEKILKADEAGLKTYREAKAAIYETHMHVEKFIKPLYLFELFIVKLSNRLNKNARLNDTWKENDMPFSGSLFDFLISEFKDGSICGFNS